MQKNAGRLYRLMKAIMEARDRDESIWITVI